MTQVVLPVGLIGRLKADFPEVVAGVKDSGTDWAYTESLLSARDDLIVLIGNESHLAAGIRKGAKGAISGIFALKFCRSRLRQKSRIPGSPSFARNS